MPRYYALTAANAQDASPWNKWSRTVYFPRQNRWKKRRSEMEKIPRGSTRNCTPPPAKKDAKSFKEMPTAIEPMFANLFGGTTPGPIVHYIPEVRSLFPIDVWRDTLRTLPDCDFVKELLHDINFGVRIGFNHDRTPWIPQITLPQPQELERELFPTERSSPSLHVFKFCLFLDGCYPEKALASSQMAYH